MIYVASDFKVLHSCDAGKHAGKFYITDHSSSAILHVTKLTLWFAQVRSVQNHLKIVAGQTGLHNCITFKNRSLADYNKLIQIVTLRHNNNPPFFEKGVNGVDVNFASTNSNSSTALHKTSKRTKMPLYSSQIKFAYSTFYGSQEKTCEFIFRNRSGNLSPKLYLLLNPDA